MLRRRAGSGIAMLALGMVLAIAPVTVASARSHKAATHHKKKQKKPTTKLGSACPTSAEMSTAAGTAYPAPRASNSAGTVVCNYADPTTGANLVLLFQSNSGTSASTLKIVADSQASAQKTTATAVSGFGSAAYVFTLDDASTNASGVATTNMFILDGSTLIDITAEATVAQVKAVARYVLTH